MKLSDYKESVRRNQEFREGAAELQFAFALGNAILHARLERGWSQAELAQHSGTKQANVSRIESGVANPTLDLIRRLCQALEIELKFVPAQKISGKGYAPDFSSPEQAGNWKQFAQVADERGEYRETKENDDQPSASP